MDTPETIGRGDVVALSVPSAAVGLMHADTNGRFRVVEVEGKRLHVTPENADAPRYALEREHVRLDSGTDNNR